MTKVALITGGTSGIGLAIAHELLINGYKVAITTRNDGERQARKLSEATNGECRSYTADVGKFDLMQLIIAQIEKDLGVISVVIANAGLGHFATVDNLSVEQWDEVISTNLNGAFYTLKATLGHLKKTKGYYISISSLAGTNFFKQGAAYNASKFGVTGFTQAAMLDLREHDIKCTTIMPGSVRTDFNGNDPSEGDQGWKIQPEDIAEMVTYLLNVPARTLPSKIEVRPSKTATM